MGVKKIMWWMYPLFSLSSFKDHKLIFPFIALCVCGGGCFYFYIYRILTRVLHKCNAQLKWWSNNDNGMNKSDPEPEDKS